MHVDNLVVDTGLVLFQYFKQSLYIFVRGEELQIGLLDVKERWGNRSGSTGRQTFLTAAIPITCTVDVCNQIH